MQRGFRSNAGRRIVQLALRAASHLRYDGASVGVILMNLRAIFVPGLALGLLAGGAACGRKADNAPPVATPSVTIDRPRAALGSPIDVTYQFEVAPGATFDGDYRVFVHFVDPDGEMMWTDDHDPVPPTSQWKAGDTIKYTRTLFVPIYPYVGEAFVELGLYGTRQQGRLPLAGQQQGQRAYRVAAMTLLPQTENVFIIFKDGWHPAEVVPDNVAVEWQWTKKDATCSFRNPRRNAVLMLHVDGQPPFLQEPQVVTVTLGEQTLDTFVLDSKAEVIRRIPVTALQMGNGDMVEIKLGVDKTFVPAKVAGGSSSDLRELGLRVFHVFVAPQ